MKLPYKYGCESSQKIVKLNNESKTSVFIAWTLKHKNIKILPQQY